MTDVDKNEFKVEPFDENSVISKKTTTTASADLKTRASKKKKTVIIKALVLYIRPKYDSKELKEFIDELMEEKQLDNSDKCASTLHRYMLESTREPVDMGNQNVLTTYCPNLFTQKNDAFGPWKFHFLLGLLELYYECGEPNVREAFPEVWKTDSTTKIHVKPVEENANDVKTSTARTEPVQQEEDVTLDDHLQVICRQNNCNEDDAIVWSNALKGTIEHLRNVAANEAFWEKLSSIKYLAKQRIRDYIQLNSPPPALNTPTDPYEKSKATLLGDIHRVRRYFHHVAKTLQGIPNLDRKAVDLAITEIREFYDDDGNVLNTIHAYLKTFCLRNDMVGENAYKQNRKDWEEKRTVLLEKSKEGRSEYNEVENKRSQAAKSVETHVIRLRNLTHQKKQVKEDEQKLIKKMTASSGKPIGDLRSDLDEFRKKFKSLDDEIQKADKSLKDFRKALLELKEKLVPLAKKKTEEEDEIQELDSRLALNLGDAHRKLNVKFGRGLLLYGPPGTGKSELLKCAAIFAGITMTTTPLAAGELNRPYVGETEKLLVDIMYRAAAIPHLICAMTIDEIDGLVPKRDNNAQQSKVDGISVLLSHIEGVKNIPNLIVFGATNRRNMMDEAFLRRMQAKCFVGRPSPQIRKKMFRPLLCKNSHTFTNKRLDFLVNITTNFSGAAVGALMSSIIVAMDPNKNASGTLTDHTLLALADKAAREFSCWFGIETLPEICRLYPDIFKSTDQQEKYSLKLPTRSPSGRILIDLLDRKCLIELTDEPTLESALAENETSTSTLISRFISKCSSRNIDTIHIIDLNFLIKHNAFDENQRFELMTTTFHECDEYNRSMLIFDIDSLIMLSVSDSNMSKSVSISNIQMYQFIREKCKKAIVEQKSADSTKTHQQIREEQDEEEKRIDDEIVKMCPKCQQNYIQSKNDHGTCHYHDGYIYDLVAEKALSNNEAQKITQKYKLAVNTHGTNDSKPKPPELMWACCLGLYGVDPTCKVGTCGLPKELKDHPIEPNQDEIELVQNHFKKNSAAMANIEDFLKTYKPKSVLPETRPASRLTTSASVTSVTKK
ncbi:unnamed protein product [Didymodactylos carnosus]|uniref:AAA+ ATPase domain-containing protein n=1 Tax=Didymodactylos carnosus TaxID=1234261 RepID=A0A814NKJ6_9BILA|nr:unnamed protein product [Didymodactylos carnosus]CAF1091745.1 unnamed protein product [Didymodactylos carnosus]CAF3613266.1 unnamed protein product [Didymodactylos carnosus]CAF3857223.1 unnamed protein product [Didymodactylos carnosus]